ncbi:MAG: PASTA domain-containing protein [Betaproteobacteria bacterium]
MAAASFAGLDAAAATADAPPATIDCAKLPAAERAVAQQAGLCRPAPKALPAYKKVGPEFTKPAAPTAPAAATTPPSAPQPAKPARSPAHTPKTPGTKDVTTTPSPVFVPPVFVPPVAVNPCASLPKLPAPTLQAAYAAYDAKRFRISSREQHSTQPPGTIIETRTQPEGRMCLVTLVVSDGQLVVVPPVVGLRTAPARAALDENGLFLEAHAREDEGPPGIALAQQPEKGTVVRRGMRVRVVFSTPARVEVPPVVGLLDERARALLVRFKVDARDVSGEARRGEVVRQVPAAGEMVAAGSVVHIAVSLGDLVRVPLVENLRRAQAVEKLRQGGLAGRIGSQDDNDAAPGVVLAQQPSAGVVVPRNSEVVLGVSRGRAVPDVKRLSFAEARSRLAGFSVDPSQTSLEDPVVVAQAPEAGSRAAAKSVVTLTLEATPAVVPPDTKAPVVTANDERGNGAAKGGEATTSVPETAAPAEGAAKSDGQRESTPVVRDGVEDPRKTGGETTSLLMVALVAVLATLGTLGTVVGARAAVRKWKARTGPKPPVRVEARIDPQGRLAQFEGGAAAGPLLRIEARLADARSEIRLEEEALHE